jgi:prepilin signal peptidase PulO-like enzyme (type II secretory pathway)
LFVPIVSACVCLVAGLFDGWTQRIPNPLTYTAVLLGVGLNGLATLMTAMHIDTGVTWIGAVGFVPSIAAVVFCSVLGLVAGLFGCSYGDLKLFVAVGAFAGFPIVGNIAVLALGIALVYALINLAVLGRLTVVLRVAAHRALELLYLRRFDTPIPEGSKLTQIPMAIPMAIAVAVMTWLQATDMPGGLR